MLSRKIRNKAMMSAFTSIEHHGSPNEIRQKKKRKDIQIFLCRKSQNIINNNKKFLALISDYSKVAGYKVYIQKSIACFYIGNEHVEFEINNTVSFMLALLRKKYLGYTSEKKICVRSNEENNNSVERKQRKI